MSRCQQNRTGREVSISECSHAKKHCSCKCCNEFGTALGKVLLESTQDIVNIISTLLPGLIAGLTAAGLTPQQIAAQVQARILIIQKFEVYVSSLVTAAFVNADISSNCCDGYANGIRYGVEGIIHVTVSRILNPFIPLGEPGDQVLGTVYGNAYVAGQEVVALITALGKIASCNRRGYG
jgi:hypothetical protein